MRAALREEYRACWLSVSCWTAAYMARRICARAEGADGFVDGNDAADFGGVRLAVAEHLELGIDHFEARGAELIDFGFAVKDELLAGLEAAFEIAAVKKFAGEQAAGGVLDEEMIDRVVDELVGDGLAAHDARANGVAPLGWMSLMLEKWMRSS